MPKRVRVISEKDRQRMRAYAKRWYEENKERERLKRLAYYAANKERLLAQSKLYYEANRERMLPSKAASAREWAKKNRERANAIGLAWHRRSRVACPAWADRKKIVAIYLDAARLSRLTGIPHHVDHIVPLRHPLVSGLHNEFNLRVITARENMRKQNKFEVI